MSLYTKTLVIIGSVLLTLVISLYFISQGILLNSYTQLEAQDVEEDVQRVLNAIADNLTQLSIENQDYAHWDDTYHYVQNPNQEYIDNNYFVETLQSLQINFLAIVSPQNEVLFARVIELETGEETLVTDELNKVFTAQSPLLNLKYEQYGAEGLLMTEEGPMLITSQRILTSLMDGPPQGILIMGRLLNAAWVQQLSESLRLSISLHATNDPDISNELKGILASFSKEHPILVQPQNSDQVNGYAPINDFYGTPALILQVDLIRSIYMQGQSNVSFFITLLILVGLIFTAVMLGLLERLVLSRLSQLSHALQRVRTTSDLTQRMPVEGKDELASLATNINATLQALTASQEQLRQANDELEERVRKRTLELSNTNQELAEEVTRHKQTHAKLLEARDHAIEALNVKSQILANMSHDARTPLSVISLRTEMLKNGIYGAVNERQIGTLDSILTNVRQLLGFITNLLNESQLQAKSLRVDTIPFQPKVLGKEVEDTMRPLVEQKGLSFKVRFSADMPETLLGDPIRLNQILTNLIDNAIKFTHQGGIFVQIFRQDHQHWGLQVSDTGIGIPADARAKIFDAFWQVDGSSTRMAGQGVGLGLSIVKELTELMGGQVLLNSDPGHGSSFTILLPLHRPEKAPADA